MIKKSLSNGTLFKPIIGAAVQNPVLARLLGYIYAMAGAILIDVRGEAAMVRAVKDGIKDAHADTAVIASVTPVEHDPHFLKATVNWRLCEGCGECAAVCPHNAIKVLSIGKARTTTENCRGCSHCVDVCSASAISMVAPEQSKPFQNIIRECLDAGTESIEFHCSGVKALEVHNALDSVKKEINAINDAGFPISVCVGSLKSSPAEILEVVQMLIRTVASQNFFIQADGETMAETKHGYGLQSLALVSLIKGAYPDVKIIASGGTTEETWKVAHALSIPISGIGMGLRSLEVVRPYISEGKVNADAAVAAAKTLFCPYDSMRSDHAETTLFQGSAWHDLRIMEA